MIGVFDSGHGGLTVLAALRKHLPELSFLYLGDHANAPYGERSPEEIYALTRDNVTALFGRGCELVVLACNTASAIALRRLQRTWLRARSPDRRVLGVLVPMVEAITRQPWTLDPAVARHRLPGPPRCVAVFATARTVASGAYPREIGKRAPEITVVQQACPGLAARIEAGAPATELRALVAGYVAALQARLEGAWPDSVVLGCTHYPLVAEDFAAVLPPSVELLDQPRLTGRSLEAYLVRHPRFAERARSGAPGVRCLTSGEPAVVSRLATRFIGRPVRFEALTPGELSRPLGLA